MEPTVSVIVPTYNRAGLLRRALDSILAQTYVDYEIIIVDDGSTDGTTAVAAEYARRLGSRMQVLRQENLGSSAARNRGIEAARGRFLAFLDSDDEYLPNKLERQLALFRLRPDLGLVYSDYAYVDLCDVRQESVFRSKTPLALAVPAEAAAAGLYACEPGLFDVLLRGYFISTITGTVRREILGESIRFPVGHEYAEEWLFFLQIARRCRAGYVDEPLCLHHHTAGSLSRSDKHRNAFRYRLLVQSIAETFENLTHFQCRIVCANVARASRQLAYHAARRGDHTEAARWLADALSYEFSVRTLSEFVGEGIRALASYWHAPAPGSGSRVIPAGMDISRPIA